MSDGGVDGGGGGGKCWKLSQAKYALFVLNYLVILIV